MKSNDSKNLKNKRLELNKHIKTDFTIMLPVTPSGEPDWQYMEEYMKEIMEEQEKNIEKLAKKGID